MLVALVWIELRELWATRGNVEMTVFPADSQPAEIFRIMSVCALITFQAVGHIAPWHRENWPERFQWCPLRSLCQFPGWARCNLPLAREKNCVNNMFSLHVGIRDLALARPETEPLCDFCSLLWMGLFLGVLTMAPRLLA